MIDTVVVAPGENPGSAVSGVSWAAIFAGAVVACALTLVLLTFGTGLGLTLVSPWAGAGVSATTFKITTGLYLIVIAMIASSLGGYLAGRLGRRFRISHGIAANITELDNNGHPIFGWCFVPRDNLASGDVMLAQKIALETDELGALKIARNFAPRW